MKLIQYIRGNRRGKEINRLEKEAMNDPFLADALDGFDSVESDDHELRINAMRAKVLSRTKSGNNRVFRYIGVAAGIVLIVGAGWYFLFNSGDAHIPQHISENISQQQIAENMESVSGDTLQDESLIAQTEIKDVKTKETKSAVKSSRKSVENKKQINIPSPRVNTDTSDLVSVEPETKKTAGKVRENVVNTNRNHISVATVRHSNNRETVNNTNNYSELSESADTDLRTDIPEQKPVNIVVDLNENTITVKGKVFDADGYAVSGCSVIEKNGDSPKGVVTNMNGEYSIETEKDKTLVFSLVGYKEQKVVVEDAILNVILEEDDQALDEIVVVGFGTRKREPVTNSTKVAVSDLNIPRSDLSRHYAGKAPSYLNDGEMQSKEPFSPKTVSGKKEYKRYLSENAVMPQSEGCKGKKGTVRVQFTIDPKGRPTNIRIKKSLCPEADKEAVRLIEQGPDWTTKDKEIEVKVRFKL
jgi:TonB family protein